MISIKRGDVFYAVLPTGKNSIQGGLRPVVVVSNNSCNTYSPVITVVPLTTSRNKHKLPTHIKVLNKDVPNIRDSIALCEQVMPIAKDSLSPDRVGKIPKVLMEKVERGVMTQLGVNE